MILSITDGIEVAEHTEPQERAEFCAEYKAAQQYATVHVAPDWPVTISRTRLALLSRQAE